MWIKRIAIIVALLFAVGCANNDNKDAQNMKQTHVDPEVSDAEKKGVLTEKLRYNEQTDITKGEDPAKVKRKYNTGQPSDMNQAEFTNEKTAEISKKIAERVDVKQAQVAMTDDRIIVALMLHHKADPKALDEIKAEVTKIAPGKEVVMYTDTDYWSKKKDMTGRNDSAETGGKMEEFLNNFFNR